MECVGHLERVLVPGGGHEVSAGLRIILLLDLELVAPEQGQSRGVVGPTSELHEKFPRHEQPFLRAQVGKLVDRRPRRQILQALRPVRAAPGSLAPSQRSASLLGIGHFEDHQVVLGQLDDPVRARCEGHGLGHLLGAHPPRVGAVCSDRHVAA